MTRYAYQNSGHPILTWKGGPPRQTRAADSVALGGLVLPRPGAPEPINDATIPVSGNYMKTPMGCGGGCMGDAEGTATAVKVGSAIVISPWVIAGIGIGAWWLLKKKR